ncbi:MAG: ACT domain-containing protein [Candidatus Aminicenantes bacterium]|nr:ACT domain-containing protein [Candidatus Aminicenantes bacterium]
MNLDLVLLSGAYAVSRLKPGSPAPAWAGAGDFVSITLTPSETSVVCLEDRVPKDVPSEKGFRALKVQGPLEFSLVGVLESMIGPLAEERISVLAMSTFDTDYLLVREDALARAVEIFIRNGHNIILPEDK